MDVKKTGCCLIFDETGSYVCETGVAQNYCSSHVSYGFYPGVSCEDVTHCSPPSAILTLATIEQEYVIGQLVELTDPPSDTALFELQPIGVSKKEKTETNIAEFVPGEIIVKFKSDPQIRKETTRGKTSIATNKASINALNDKHDILESKKVAKTDKFEKLKNIHLLKLPKEKNVLAVVDEYNKDLNVEYAEPNYIVKVIAIPNDPDFSQLWGLHNTGQTGGTEDADIDAVEAWDIRTGSNNIIVAVIDTGVDYTHEDLADNIYINPGEIPGNGIDDDNNGYIDDVNGWEFINNYNNPMDDNGHGTHVAGTIGAVGSNAIGINGVNWNVNIMPLKFLDSFGSGTTSDAITAVEYATLMSVDILSNSWGGSGYSQALNDAIEAANQAGILFIAAAGNDAMDNDRWLFFPANYDNENVISIAATDHNDDLSWFSNYGKSKVDLAAPGEGIYSTFLEYAHLSSNCNDDNGDGYGYCSGTSMATPHVSGATALIMAQYPSLTHLQVKDMILDRVDKISSLEGKTVTGGRLNLFKALDSGPFADASQDQNVKVDDVVSFNGYGFDPDGGLVTFEWDFESDGIIDNTEQNPTHVYTQEGIYTVTLIITDSEGKTDTDTTTIKAEIRSQIKNEGSTVTGYLLMKILKDGFDYQIIVDESSPRTISAGNVLALDTIWKNAGGFIPTEIGDYQVYAALRDVNGDVLQTQFGPVEDSYDFSVIKDPGVILWSRTHDTGSGDLDSDWPEAIAIDLNDNLYVVGREWVNDFDLRIEKLDSTGASIWNKTYDLGGLGVAYDVAVDSTGFVYLAGIEDGKDGLVMKLDSNGNTVWTKTYDFGGFDRASDIAVDSVDNLYVFGDSDNDWIITKLDGNGDIIWSVTDSTSIDNTAKSISIDSTDNVYVVGYSGFISDALDWRVKKLDSNGNTVWTKTYELIGGNQAFGVITDSYGDIYVVGDYEPSTFSDWRVMKIDSGGNTVGNRVYDWGRSDIAYDVAVDSTGFVYVIGSFQSLGTIDWDINWMITKIAPME